MDSTEHEITLVIDEGNFNLLYTTESVRYSITEPYSTQSSFVSGKQLLNAKLRRKYTRYLQWYCKNTQLFIVEAAIVNNYRNCNSIKCYKMFW